MALRASQKLRWPLTLCLAALVVPQPCWGQGYSVGGSRPSQSDKIKVHSEFTVKEAGNTAVLPKLGIAVSVAPTLEIGADLQVKHIAGSSNDSTSGFGDAEIKAKYLLLDAATNAAGINMSAELKLSLPIGDQARGLGDGRPAIKLPITFSKRHAAWEFGGLIGVQHALHNDRTTALGGVLVTRMLGEAWKVGGEIVTEWHWEQRQPEELMANFGLRYLPSRRLELFLIAGRSIHTRGDGDVIRFKLGLELMID